MWTKVGVDDVSTFGFGLGGRACGLPRFLYVFAGSQCL